MDLFLHPFQTIVSLRAVLHPALALTQLNTCFEGSVECTRAGGHHRSAPTSVSSKGFPPSGEFLAEQIGFQGNPFGELPGGPVSFDGFLDT
jgi:hypothetical protein